MLSLPQCRTKLKGLESPSLFSVDLDLATMIDFRRGGNREKQNLTGEKGFFS